MDHMFLSSPAPFMTMATADYYPYPMHTAQDSSPRRRRFESMSTSSALTSECNGRIIPKIFLPTKLGSKSAAQPKPVQRVDSGFDAASETSSITLTEEVERRHALQLYLHQYHNFEDACLDDEEDSVDEGNLGRRARNSICINTKRASTWESKEVRTRRNRKSKLKMIKKWLKRLLVPGSDGSSWYLTAAI